MADGVNISVLPESTSLQGNDKILFDRYVSGTGIIAFSAVKIDENQTTFYNNILTLSANTNTFLAYLSSEVGSNSTNILSLSTTTTYLSSEVSTNTSKINAVSSSLIQLSASVVGISTNLNLVSANVVQLSANTSTFLSGGISPSGSIVPAKVGIFYLAADTKDIFVSIDTNTNKDWKQILTLGY
jgi:hypothetical protein